MPRSYIKEEPAVITVKKEHREIESNRSGSIGWYILVGIIAILSLALFILCGGVPALRAGWSAVVGSTSLGVAATATVSPNTPKFLTQAMTNNAQVTK